MCTKKGVSGSFAEDAPVSDGAREEIVLRESRGVALAVLLHREGHLVVALAEVALHTEAVRATHGGVPAVASALAVADGMQLGALRRAFQRIFMGKPGEPSSAIPKAPLHATPRLAGRAGRMSVRCSRGAHTESPVSRTPTQRPSMNR